MGARSIQLCASVGELAAFASSARISGEVRCRPSASRSIADCEGK